MGASVNKATLSSPPRPWAGCSGAGVAAVLAGRPSLVQWAWAVTPRIHVRTQLPKRSKRDWWRICLDEVYDVAFGMPFVGGTLSKHLGDRSVWVRRLYDSESRDLSEAYELLNRVTEQSLLDSQENWTDWLRASLKAEEGSGLQLEAMVERQFWVAKAGSIVVAFAYFQYYPGCQMCYVSY